MAGTLAVWAGVTAAQSDGCNEHDFICFDLRGPLWMTSGLLAATAIASWMRAAEDEREERAKHPPPMPIGEVAAWNDRRRADDARAVAALSQRIHVAARAGDCPQVRAIAERLRDLDPYGVAHASTTDAAIGACFAGGDQPQPGAPPGW